MEKAHRVPIKTRAARRAHLAGEAVLLLEGELERGVNVHDLSPAGCMVEAAGTLPIGAEVVIAMPGLGFVSATIVWQVGDRAGLEFDAPITSRRVFAAIVEAFKARSIGRLPGR